MLRPILLEFVDKADEDAFGDHFARQALSHYRAATIGTLVLWSSIAALDVGRGRNVPMLLALRFLVAVPPVVAAVVLGYARFDTFRRHWQQALVAAGAGVLFTAVAMSAVMPADQKEFLLGFCLANLGFFTVAPVRFRPGVAVSALAVLAYALVFFHVLEAPRAEAVGNTFWIVASTAIGALGLYNLERFRRRDFLQSRQIAREQEKSEALLRNILPASVAAQLKANQHADAEQFESATVLFADIVGFTPLSGQTPPAELVGVLDEVFTKFDDLAEKYGLEKIKTIGDAYMAAAGVPHPRPDHAVAAVGMALEMAEVVATRTVAGQPLALRIGLHSGPLVAGVIGKKKFTYDLWGDTVNTASRMESHGLPGRVQVSEATAQLVEREFELDPRGTILVKGKGEMPTFLVVRRRASAAGKLAG